MTVTTEAIPSTFTSSPSYTLGVELEFQTLDTESLNLAPLAPVLLDTAPAILRPRITHEWIRITSYNVCYTKLLRERVKMKCSE